MSGFASGFLSAPSVADFVGIAQRSRQIANEERRTNEFIERGEADRIMARDRFALDEANAELTRRVQQQQIDANALAAENAQNDRQANIWAARQVLGNSELGGVLSPAMIDAVADAMHRGEVGPKLKAALNTVAESLGDTSAGTLASALADVSVAGGNRGVDFVGGMLPSLAGMIGRGSQQTAAHDRENQMLRDEFRRLQTETQAQAHLGVFQPFLDQARVADNMLASAMDAESVFAINSKRMALSLRNPETGKVDVKFVTPEQMSAIGQFAQGAMSLLAGNMNEDGTYNVQGNAGGCRFLLPAGVRPHPHHDRRWSWRLARSPSDVRTGHGPDRLRE